jgi:hypothetical protein
MPPDALAALVRDVHDKTAEVRAMLAGQSVRLEGIESSSRETATASMRMADIMAERAQRDKDERAEALARMEVEVATKSLRISKIAEWWAANWKYIGGVALLIFYPQVIRQAQDLGLMPALAVDSPAAATAPAEPVLVPAPLPAQESAP